MSILLYKDILPKINDNTFIAPGATVIGRVVIEDGSSVWHNAVLRGDVDDIYVGKNSNIQDCSVVHSETNFKTTIGDNVTIGHSAVIHGCTIKNNVLIGMNATVLNGAVIGEGSIVGANALIPQGKVIPPNSLVVGVPGKVIKTVSKEEVEDLIKHAHKYRELWQQNYK